MNVLKVISTTPIQFNCFINEELWETPEFDVFLLSGDEDEDGVAEEMANQLSQAPDQTVMMVGRNGNGDYIGTEEFARKVVEVLGIAPEMRTPDCGTCSVGFCVAEDKWWGWSHRAAASFGIGSTCKRGDCGYNTPNATAFGQSVQDFFCDHPYLLHAKNTPSVNADGKLGVLVTATYSDDVTNEKLRGTEYRHFSEYPAEFGRGEWVAETMQDAKQMACDFAEGVA